MLDIDFTIIVRLIFNLVINVCLFYNFEFLKFLKVIDNYNSLKTISNSFYNGYNKDGLLIIIVTNYYYLYVGGLTSNSRIHT